MFSPGKTPPSMLIGWSPGLKVFEVLVEPLMFSAIRYTVLPLTVPVGHAARGMLCPPRRGAGGAGERTGRRAPALARRPPPLPPPLAAVQLICHCCSACCWTLYGWMRSGWLADATP